MRTRTSATMGILLVLLTTRASSLVAQQQDPATIFDMDTARHKAPAAGKDGQAPATVEVVEGKLGKACRFQFAPESKGAFCTASVRPTPAWDEAAGISFYVKGDGSNGWGGLEMIDGSDYALRYGYCFPIDSTEWRKITVPWRDLVPELPAGAPVDAKTGYAPSRFGNLWFGKWFYWRDYPACSFTIDQIALEPSLPAEKAEAAPVPPGLSRFLAKLRAKQPVTIVTMGDSLSDKRHWANREVLWSELAVQQLREKFGGEVRLVNPAIGGTLLSQNLVLMPRWLKDTPKPDLVTVCFGYNDWSSGMRRQRWEETLRFAVERIRRMTEGQSDVLLMTTCPALERWDTMEELAEGVRVVSAEQKTGLADIAATFHRAGTEPSARAALYCWDKTHLGKAGHALVAETVVQAILEGK